MTVYGLTKKNNICGVNLKNQKATFIKLDEMQKDFVRGLIETLNENKVSLYHVNEVIAEYFD